MLELLKDKVMLSFIILVLVAVLVAVYFDAVNTKRLEEEAQQEEYIQYIINN